MINSYLSQMFNQLSRSSGTIKSTPGDDTSPSPKSSGVIPQKPADAKQTYQGVHINPRTGEIIRPWNFEQAQRLGSEWKQTTPTYNQLVEAYGVIPGSGGQIDFDRKYNPKKTGFALSSVENSIIKDIRADIQQQNALSGEKIAKLADKYDSRILAKTLRNSGYNVTSNDITQTQIAVKYGSLARAIASGVDRDTLSQFSPSEVSKASDFVNSLSPSERQILKTEGFEGLQQYVDVAQRNQESSFQEVKNAQDEVAKYDNPIQAALEGKINRQTWEQAGLALEGLQGSPADSYTAIENIRQAIEKYGDLPSAMRANAVSAYDVNSVYGAKELMSAIEWNEGHVFDPETGIAYEDDWYKRGPTVEHPFVPIAPISTKSGLSVLDIVMDLTGSDKQHATQVIQSVFDQKGISGIDEYIQNLNQQRLDTLKKYESIKPYTDIKSHLERDMTPPGYDINQMADDLLKKGKSENQVKAEMARMGFSESVASNAIRYSQSSPQERFDILQKQGVIPEDAAYIGQENGNPTFIIKDEAYIKAEREVNRNPTSRYTAFVLAYNYAKENRDTNRNLYDELKYIHDNNKVYYLGQDTYDQLSPQAQSLMVNLTREGNKEFIKQVKYLTPGYGTYLTAKERGLTSGWTIASALGDALLIAGVIGGAASGARAYGLPSSAGRVKAAVQGATRSLIGIPKSATELKQSLTQPVINAIDRVRMDFIPLSALEQSSGTARIPISVAGSAEDAIEIRNLLMDKLISGEKPVVTYKGVSYEINQALIKGPAHATPSSQFLSEGVIVAKKAGMSEAEQGLFIGAGVHSRFVPASAFGKTGVTPGVGIFGDSARYGAVNTGKVYRGIVEMEKKLPVGTELPQMTRQGYSRTASGEKFDILAEDNISNLRKIAGKITEPIAQVRDTYTPAITVKGAQVKDIDLLAEASRYDEAASLAENSGDIAKASLMRSEAMALREERLARPLTAGAARTIAVMFTKYAASLRSESAQIREVSDVETLQRIADRLDAAAGYLQQMSRDNTLLSEYNRYLSLNPDDKIQITEIVRNMADNNVRPSNSISVMRPLRTDTNKISPVHGRSFESTSSIRSVIRRGNMPLSPEILRVGEISMSRRTPRIVESRKTLLNDDELPPPSSLPEGPYIESASGIPENPGEVAWKQGKVWIKAKPPSPDNIQRGKRGQVEVIIEPPHDAPRKIGTPQQTLFDRGNPPKEMVVRVGFTRAKVTNGRKIDFDYSPEYMVRSGKKIRSHHERQVMKRRRKS